MNLKDIWERLTQKSGAAIEFEEFEELLNDWAWREYERQRESAEKNTSLEA